MTRAEKEEAMKKLTIGIWTDLGGIEVKDIQYGIDDYLVCVTGATTSKPKVQRLKVYSTATGRAYVITYNRKLYLDECLRW